MTDDEPPAPPASLGRTRAPRPNRRLSWSATTRDALWRLTHKVLGTDMLWSGALVATVVLVLGARGCGDRHEPLRVGQRATADIKAAADFEFVDVRSTEEERRQAVAEVLDVYDHDTEREGRRARQLAELCQGVRQALQRAAEVRLSASEAVGRELAGQIPPPVLAVLIARGASLEMEREMTAALRGVLARRVVSSLPILERENAITLRSVPGERTERIESFEGFLDLDQARQAVRDEILARLQLPADERRVLADFTASFVDATVNLNTVATDEARRAAERGVRSVIRRVRQGDLLAREGEPLTQDVIGTIDAARRQHGGRLGIRGLLSVLLLGAMFAFFIYRYAQYHQRHFRKIEHLHTLLVMMMLSMLALSSGVLWIARGVVDNLTYPFNRVDGYAYLIPLGAGAILVALLANGRIATVYAAFTALLFGAANDWDAFLMTWAMLVQCSGVYAISTYRERAALLRAGLVVGGAAAVTAFALENLEPAPESLAHGLYGAGLACVGGAIGTGLVVSFALPILERVFNVLTDIRLLELSNLNHPLLADLAVRAPGSYNHSLVVGTLAEEAARAIGANALFCRVAAFYHDIGKMNKAEYFVENQRGPNPHDRLSPSMSALIIASHVKDGIHMAREAGLPEQIVDIIPQHHGTKLMTFFYEKARQSADPALGPVQPDDFRYPGPKPQTREAAIFMLADGVEAAARTIDEPTANRLREMIRKITNAVVLDRELDACDLTFADLERIQEAFLRCLVSMYHHRLDYPGFDFGRPKGELLGGASGSGPGEPSAVRGG